MPDLSKHAPNGAVTYIYIYKYIILLVKVIAVYIIE